MVYFIVFQYLVHDLLSLLDFCVVFSLEQKRSYYFGLKYLLLMSDFFICDTCMCKGTTVKK